jgi:6-phosphogluconolactonase (cycloisomerase 2 family)
MLQAITTRFIGPTNSKGSRFSATCRAGRVIVPRDYALNANDNHIAAANALRKKLGWMDIDMQSGMNHKHEGVHVLCSGGE